MTQHIDRCPNCGGFLYVDSVHECKKPEALRLADILETNLFEGVCTSDERQKAAAELRRQQKEIEAKLREKNGARIGEIK